MITITKDQIENLVKMEKERKKANPWDAEGDEQRMFTALVFEEAEKHVPLFLTMFLMTSMVYRPATAPDKEKAIKELSKDPVLVHMIADLLYLGYQLGRLESNGNTSAQQP